MRNPFRGRTTSATMATHASAEPRVYRTKTGRVLTDADIEGFAAEAEAGYDVAAVRAGPPRRTGAGTQVVIDADALRDLVALASGYSLRRGRHVDQAAAVNAALRALGVFDDGRDED